jgi:outer membrane protein assembly factor BamB
MADGKRLQIVTPSHSLLVTQADVPILVNAYETSADIASVTYQVSADGSVVDTGSLSPEGQWSWRGLIPAAKAPRGGYELQVTCTNDRGEVQTTTTTFTVLGLNARPPATQADWLQFGGGPQRGGATSAVLTPPLGHVWSHHTGGTLDFASPVLKGDQIYIGVKDRGDFDNNGVLALRASDGARAWFTPTPAAVSHSVVVDADRVYACSHGGLVHALSRTTGEGLWSRALGSDRQRFQYAAPVLLGDQLYAGTFAYFARFDAVSGAPVWNHTYGGDWISSNGCPAVSGTTVVVPANWQTASLRAVNATTGVPLWSYGVRGLHGSPVISGQRVVFTDYDGRLHCASLTNGAPLWNHDLGGGSSACTPAVAHGIVVAGGTGSIRGYRLDTGTQLWSVPTGTSALKMAPYNNGYAALVGSPTIADHTAYVPCGDGKLYALTLETGAILWSTDFGTPLLSAPCISGNTLFLSAFDGNVYALSSYGVLFMPADFDRDEDIDQSDFGHLQACLSSSSPVPIEPGCEDANLTNDNVIDELDLAVFLDCFTGPKAPSQL